VVRGFSVDDTVDKMKPYAQQYKINYPLLVGNGREDVQEAFGPLFGIPVSVIIGRDGKIAKKHSGIATKSQFEREIKALL
jgi:peroxiredoxin